MDESALQDRIATIERRQSYVLLLLVGLYVLGGSWLLVSEVPGLTVWNVGLNVVLLALVVLSVWVFRRRKRRG